MKYIKVHFFQLLTFLLSIVVPLTIFAETSADKVYTFEQLEEAAMFLRLTFDTKKDFCRRKGNLVPQYLQVTKTVIDNKIAEEFCKNNFNIEKFTLFLKDADRNCVCNCGIYTYIYEQLEVELAGKNQDLENVYQALEQKSKKLSLAEQLVCVQSTEKWYCESALLKNNSK